MYDGKLIWQLNTVNLSTWIEKALNQNFNFYVICETHFFWTFKSKIPKVKHKITQIKIPMINPSLYPNQIQQLTVLIGTMNFDSNSKKSNDLQ